MTRAAINKQPVWRLCLVSTVAITLLGVVSWKLLDLQVINNEVLQEQGNKRTVRNDVIVAHRGNIMDRNGQALAISTPVQSLWLNPREIIPNPEAWNKLAAALASIEINTDVLRNKVQDNAEREFLYIKRRLPPAEVQSILDLKIRGVYSQEEYKRFYPLGEVAVHVVGLTNSDDVGQEGLELAYEDWLQGKPGSKQVLKDRRGGIIREVKINSVAEPGNDLVLSIDSRIQFLAYKALKEEVTRRYAKAGTAVVLNVETGEVLAMVSQPSYNPNNRISLDDNEMRNRAIVDLLEPGSTVKPFTITAALESGLFDSNSIIDTNPGYIQVDGSTKKDPVNYKEVDLKKIITKSSQVGAIKLGLAMGEGPMLDVLSRVGFGAAIGTGFPGEATGVLPNFSRWSKSDIATLAYGYGFQVTPLQMAQAYMIYANEGIRKPVSLLKTEGPVLGERVVDAGLARQVNSMLETVVSTKLGGTGVRAAIPSYQVAGKTGTAWYYNVGGGYDEENYNSYFAGFVPAHNPKIVAVVSIHEPKGEEYGGGQVAAPVFAKIAAGAMRILNVPPDTVEESQAISWSDL
ncbi:MAG: penicillin-binding protein 2 [Gammaproteobacteria bacterium]|nr:penicillin-binding protein 2 [Gammaproteobacteria bacterium]MBT6043460.1 penicillin-binding protein 2 [Gammaproteobacteria bacterium]